MRKPILSRSYTFHVKPGVRLRAEVGAPNAGLDTPHLPGRRFTVDKTAPVRAGNIVTGLDAQFLLADFAEYEQSLTFLALQANAFLDYYKPGRSVDPLTGLPRGETKPQLVEAKVPVSLQPQAFGTEMNVDLRRAVIISTIHAAAGDRFGDWTVQNVAPFRGLWEMEVS